MISTNFTNAIFEIEYALKFFLKLVTPPPENRIIDNLLLFFLNFSIFCKIIRFEKKFVFNVFSNFFKSKPNTFLISPKSPIAFIIKLVFF